MAKANDTGPLPAPDAAGAMARHDAELTAPSEEDGEERRHPPGKAAAPALGAVAAGLGAVAAAELLDPRPGTSHSRPATGTSHAHAAGAHPWPGHAPGPRHAPDLVISPAANPGYPLPQPGTGQAGSAGGPSSTGRPGTTGGSAPGWPAAGSGANGSAANGAQPGQPATPLRTSAQSWPSAHSQPGLAVPATSLSGTAAPSPATPPPAAPAARWANLASRPAISSGPPVRSLAATGTPSAAATPPPPQAAATALQPAAATTTASQSGGPWSVLYDSAGHPAGIANAAGAFSAFPGTGTASASAASPLTLYDSAGQQAGIYTGASRLLPLATAAQSPWLAGIPPAPTAPAAQTGAGAAPASPGPQQALIPVQPTSVQSPGAQINQKMLSDTPAQRQQAIRQGLQQALNNPGTTSDQRTAIQQALDGNIADLPDSFYAHGDYTYTDQNGKTTTLNTLEAATTVAMLQAQYSHFSVDIQDLSDTAGKLYDKGDDISIPAMSLGLAFAAVGRMWDTISADLGNSADPHIQAAQANFTQLRNTFFGGMVSGNTATACYSHNTKGNIPMTAQAIRDKADTLYGFAAVYAYLEETNLSQFGVPASDPRPAWEKARFTVKEANGQPTWVDNSTTGKYPPGYFDPNNPGSPFYDGKGPL